jgi:hypothetical protein
MIRFADLDLDPPRARLRNFGFIGAAILLVASFFTFRSLLAVALLFALLAAVKPEWLRWPWRVLTIATFPIGWAVSRLFLVLLYFIVITPIALVLRVVRRGPHVHGYAREAETYWIETAAEKKGESYLEQF